MSITQNAEGICMIIKACKPLESETLLSLYNALTTLRWRHNGHDGVSNHQPHYCLLNRLFRRISKKTSKPGVTGLCVGNSPETGEFPAQMASNAENVSIWWRHHDISHSIWCSGLQTAAIVHLHILSVLKKKIVRVICGVILRINTDPLYILGYFEQWTNKILLYLIFSMYKFEKRLQLHLFEYIFIMIPPLQWHYNERDGVSNHQPCDCLLNRLFRRRSKKTSKLRVTGLCQGNSPVTGEFPAQRASNAENVSISWRHHDTYCQTKRPGSRHGQFAASKRTQQTLRHHGSQLQNYLHNVARADCVIITSNRHRFFLS